uniref:Uncharacterized protein n=1 Tax=Zea mays TaxID=4577 RepID=B4FES5_MAIZE|nr:unknown [Zea mays]
MLNHLPLHGSGLTTGSGFVAFLDDLSCNIPNALTEGYRRDHPGRNWKLVSARRPFWSRCRAYKLGCFLTLINIVVVNLDSQNGETMSK